MVQVPQISPLIRYRDVLKSSQWLIETFGFTEQQISRDADNNVMFIALVLGDQQILVCPTSNPVFEKHMSQPDQNGGFNTQSCYIAINDLEEHCRRARAAGGKIIIEPADDGEGGKFYTCRDPEGHLWNFGTRSFAPEKTEPKTDAVAQVVSAESSEAADETSDAAESAKEIAEGTGEKAEDARSEIDKSEKGKFEKVSSEKGSPENDKDARSEEVEDGPRDQELSTAAEDTDALADSAVQSERGESVQEEHSRIKIPEPSAEIETIQSAFPGAEEQTSETDFKPQNVDNADTKRERRRPWAYAALVLFALTGWGFLLLGSDEDANLLSVKETQLAEQKKSLQQFEQQLDSNQNALKQAASLQTELRSKIRELESVNADMVRQNSELTEDLEQAKNTDKAGTSELQSIQSELGSTKTALETTSDRLQASLTRLQTIQHRNAELEAHLVKSSETIQSDQRRIAALEKQNETLKNSINPEQKSELAAVKADLKASAEKLQVSLSEQNLFKSRVANLEQQLLNSRRAVQSEKRGSEKLRVQNESLKNTLESNSKANQRLRAELAKLEQGQKKRQTTNQSERRAVQDQIKKLQQNLSKEREVNTQLGRAVELYKKESQEQRNLKAQLMTELKQVRLNLSNTKSQHSATTKRYIALKKDYEALVSEMKRSGTTGEVKSDTVTGKGQKQASAQTGDSNQESGRMTLNTVRGSDKKSDAESKNLATLGATNKIPVPQRRKTTAPAPAVKRNILTSVCAEQVRKSIPQALNVHKPRNLAKLCKNSEHTVEPVKCFSWLMSGKVDWGAGNIWTPTNAVRLCGGTRNALATVHCFEGALKGANWKAAIRKCGR